MKNNRLKFTRIWKAAAVAGATLLAMSTPGTGRASASVSIVASLPELAAIAKDVGGAKVSVYSVARQNRDYHSIEARPSDVQRVARANLVVRSGLGLDAWMDALMNAAGNSRLNRGGAGYVDASASIPLIEVPQSQITGASGDVHADGNPHYYYDPIYAKFVARNILRGLLKVDAKNAEFYRANYLHFNAEITRRMKGWNAELAPYVGRSVVTYHRNYNYFLRRFGIRQYGTVEPKPGIPPSASHVNALIQSMKRNKVKSIFIEGIYPTRFPDLMARQLGIRYVVGPYSVSSIEPGGYFALVDSLVDHAKQALNQ